MVSTLFRYVLFLCFLVITISCQNESKPLLEIDGTKAMVDSIDAIFNRTDFANHPYEYGERLKIVKDQIYKASEANHVTAQLFRIYALALLNAGEIEAAVGAFEDIVNQIPANEKVSQLSKALHEGWAIANLRFGEVRNCILNHNEESCIFPIQGKGIHKDLAGSTMAIHILTEILKIYPNDLQSRWLLNLAYMTLDEYPDGVPAQWLIPDVPPNSQLDFPVFPNIALNLGLDINKLAGGIVVDDFNNDGFLDIMVSSWGMKDQLRYFEHNGKDGFIDRTQEAGLFGLTGGLNLKQTDFNNDGYLDLYVTRGAWKPFRVLGILPNSLLMNNGDGTFSDVTIETGLYSQEPSQTAIWADFNLDGWLDLFIGNESVNPDEEHPCQFYLNNKNGKFTEMAADLGLDLKHYIKGSTSGDINNDGWPDIYVSALNSRNYLFLNQGQKTLAFKEVAVDLGVEEPLQSFPCWFFDYNNDGNEDLFVAAFDQYAFRKQSAEVAASFLGVPHQGDVPRMYKNLGNGQFQDVANAMGIDIPLHPMGCNFGDINNDGYLDFYLGTGAPDYRAVVPNRMLLNQKGESFKDVTYAGRFGVIQKGHGISFADVDNDGDQDIYAVMGGSYTGDNFQNVFFQNPGFKANWVCLKLEGSKSNRAAIGAKVKLTVNSPTRGEWHIYRTVDSGASFGANSLQLEIGMGDATEIKNVEVKWPIKKSKFVAYGSFPMYKKITIIEGEKEVLVEDLRSIQFDLTNTTSQHNH